MPFYLLRIIIFSILKLLSRTGKDLDSSLDPKLKIIAENPLHYFSKEEIKVLVAKGIFRLRKAGAILLIIGIAAGIIFHLFFYTWREIDFFHFFNSWLSMPILGASATAIFAGIISFIASLGYEFRNSTKLKGFILIMTGGVISCFLITTNYRFTDYAYLGSFYLTPLFYVSLLLLFGGYLMTIVFSGIRNKKRRRKLGILFTLTGICFLYLFPMLAKHLPESISVYFYGNITMIMIGMVSLFTGLLFLFLSFIKRLGPTVMPDEELPPNENPDNLPAYFSDLVTFRIIGSKDWKRNIKAEYNPYSLPKESNYDIPDDEIYLL